MMTPEPDEPLQEPGPWGVGTPTDRTLLRRLQRGQADASTELYLRYAERLLALAASQSSPDLARRVDPEDIVQSVFRTFFRRASLGHYAVPDGEEIWKLLLVIALNKVRATAAFHRAAKRDVRRTAGGDAFERAVEGRSGHDESALDFLRMVIDELLEGLPESHRRIIELRIEGHEVNDIAAAAQRSKRSVERVLQDFRQRLDALIGEDR
jgi:DNA-directed RNA polymerase specialized sigma24 family protein